MNRFNSLSQIAGLMFIFLSLSCDKEYHYPQNTTWYFAYTPVQFMYANRWVFEYNQLHDDHLRITSDTMFTIIIQPPKRVTPDSAQYYDVAKELAQYCYTQWRINLQVYKLYVSDTADHYIVYPMFYF